MLEDFVVDAAGLVVDAARVGGRLRFDVAIRWDSDGRVVSVADFDPDRDRDLPRHAGLAIPGVPNLHSHAFQRSMVGHAECAADGARDDTFWTWREAMYAVAAALGPAELEAVATWLQIEMLRAGYTALGEFHYLHAADRGLEQDMLAAHVRAAERTGIRLCLLPVAYFRGGFAGEPLSSRQEPFSLGGRDGFLSFFERAVGVVGTARHCSLGVAPHSLRAIDVADLVAVVEGVRAMVVDAPVHIHIAEQKLEIEACLAATGKRPVELLLEHVDVDRRWCAVHATHLSGDERSRLAKSGAVAGLCPSTEANLGDGFFDLDRWIAEGGAFGVGSDSQVAIDPAAEFRLLEYGHRLRSGRRCVLASEDERSTGLAILDGATQGGLRSLGFASSEPLEAGAHADLVILDCDLPRYAGHGLDSLVDAWVFGERTGGSAVRQVFVGGRQVVSERHHAEEDAAAAAWATVCRSIFGRSA